MRTIRPGKVMRDLALSRLAVAAMVLATGCADDGAEEPRRTPLPVDGAVSADTPEATRAGLEVLAMGGNAVDAAVAVSLVLGVTQPSESGIGGSVVMLILPKGGEGVVIDGGQASGAPDALRVLYGAWTKHGSGLVSWEELVQPAIRAAAEGFALGRFSHRTIVREYDRILAEPGAARLLLAPDRSIPAEASRVTNPELAAVLERVALDGPEAFYGGEVGSLLLRAASRLGVPLDSARLAGAPRPREVRALRGRYGDRTVWTAPAPYGGRVVLDALAFLELAPRAWIAGEGWARTAWLAEALTYAWTGGGVHPVQHFASLPPMPGPGVEDSLLVQLEKARTEARIAAGPDTAAAGDSAGVPAARNGTGVPAARNGAPEGGREGAPARGRGAGAPLGPLAPLEPGTAPGSEPYVQPPGAPPERPGVGPLRPQGHTTHFSVVDGHGNAVSVTQSLGAPFGSGLAEGLGFFLEAADVPAPAAPTIVTRGDRVEMVLGSPGGDRAPSAVVQVIFRALELEEDLEDAVLAPRLHVAPASDSLRRLFLEGLVPQDTFAIGREAAPAWSAAIATLAAERGFVIGAHGRGPVVQGLDPWFGGVNVVAWTGTGWVAVGDKRRDGVGGVLRGGAPSLRGADVPLTGPEEAPED